ncbi:MAG: hypothetical protein ACFBSF_10800 [Leptolyngbyaceae cyanobacterium]
MNRTILQAVSGVAFIGTLIGISHLSSSPLPVSETVLVQTQNGPNKLEAMTLERLAAILQEEALDLEGGDGQWQLLIEGQQLLVITDAASDRMRIVTPVAEANTLSVEQVEAMLVANFHTALDARYAVTEGTVVSVFVHPLSSLQEADLRSGLYQVATLANTFGTSYSSGGLGFGAPEEGTAQEGEVQI